MSRAMALRVGLHSMQQPFEHELVDGRDQVRHSGSIPFPFAPRECCFLTVCFPTFHPLI